MKIWNFPLKFSTRGIYTLLIFISEEIELTIGKLGKQKFPNGYYIYTGSALGIGATNLKHRISRHLNKQKKMFLEKKNHKPERGWCFDFEMPEEATNTFITEEELIKKLREGSKEYYWHEGQEVMKDLEDMFESVCEDLYDEFETEELIDKHIMELIEDCDPRSDA